jgi:uncharacterized protein with HEPN domain
VKAGTRDRYRHILEACRDGAELVVRGRPAFDADALLVRAAKNVLSEIGEAAKAIDRLDESELERTGYARWREVKGMRDVVAHQYQAVELDVLWDTLAKDLPDIGNAVARRIGVEPIDVTT